MALAKPKGLLGVVLGGSSKDGPPMKGKPDAMSPKRMAAEDMLEAFEAGDAAALETAFQRMYDACAMKSEDDMGMSEEY